MDDASGVASVVLAGGFHIHRLVQIVRRRVATVGQAFTTSAWTSSSSGMAGNPGPDSRRQLCARGALLWRPAGSALFLLTSGSGRCASLRWRRPTTGCWRRNWPPGSRGLRVSHPRGLRPVRPHGTVADVSARARTVDAAQTMGTITGTVTKIKAQPFLAEPT